VQAHEKFRVQISEVESGGSSNHGSINAIVEDLTAKVETLTFTVKADSALRLAVEEKLEQSCKASHADSEQALDKVRLGLKLELTEFSGKKDEQDKALREAHDALQRELREHKQSTEKERLLYQKDVQEFSDHKTSVQSENDSLKSQLQRNSSPSPSTYRSSAEDSGLISEGSVQQTMQSHTELINS